MCRLPKRHRLRVVNRPCGGTRPHAGWRIGNRKCPDRSADRIQETRQAITGGGGPHRPMDGERSMPWPSHMCQWKGLVSDSPYGNMTAHELRLDRIAYFEKSGNGRNMSIHGIFCRFTDRNLEKPPLRAGALSPLEERILGRSGGANSVGWRERCWSVGEGQAYRKAPGEGRGSPIVSPVNLRPRPDVVRRNRGGAWAVGIGHSRHGFAGFRSSHRTPGPTNRRSPGRPTRGRLPRR